MVQLATAHRNSTASTSETIRSLSSEPLSPAAIPAEMSEAILRKLVTEMVAEQIERVAEIAVQRALSATAHRQRIVHDLTPVSDLPLPTRIAKALQRMKIKTVAQLTAMHEEEILLSPNLGERSLNQLKQVLGLYGRSLTGESCLAHQAS